MERHFTWPAPSALAHPGAGGELAREGPKLLIPRQRPDGIRAGEEAEDREEVVRRVTARARHSVQERERVLQVDARHAEQPPEVPRALRAAGVAGWTRRRGGDA